MCDFNCTYCVWNGEKLCCSASDMKEVGENVVKEYNLLSGGIGKKYSENWYYGYGVKPEWCPLTEIEVLVKDINKGFEDLFESFKNLSIDVVKSENIETESNIECENNSEEGKREDSLALTLSVQSYRTDKEGRMVLYSVNEAEIVFDELCTDENKKKQIIDFLNTQCKTSSFYIDENYGIYCLEKAEKAIDIYINIQEESLPEYINFIRVPGYFSISGKYNKLMRGNLRTLRGCPRYVGLGFNCSCNKLESLEYAPEVVNFKEKDEDLTRWGGQLYDDSVSFDCGDNLLTSLENCPVVRKGSILCRRNKIKSLKGIQSEINGSLDCSENELSSFDYLPKIGNWFYADSNLFQDINEKEIKENSGCQKLSIRECDIKIKRKSLTSVFLKKATAIFGNLYDFSNTVLLTPNGRIDVKCKKHNLTFEAYPNEFIEDAIVCPICRIEKYGFKTHNRKDYTIYPIYQQLKYISVHHLCKDKELIDKIAKFIIANVKLTIYYTFFIGEDYTIDIEPGYEFAWQGLNNPNKGVLISVPGKRIPEYIKFGEAIVSSFTITSKREEKVNSFEGCPNRVFGDFICKHENVSSFIGMPIFIGGIFDISDNILDDNAWDYAKEHINAEIGDYNISKNKFIKYRKKLY